MTRKTKRATLGARIIAGLEDAVAHSKGAASRAVVHVPHDVDVAAIRKRQGLSQAAFAQAYGFALNSIQNWEAKRRKPEGPARVLLRVIDRAPGVVRDALRKGRD